MKYIVVYIFSILLLGNVYGYHNNDFLYTGLPGLQDTVPEICNIVTDKDMKTVSPFSSSLTKIFPDDGNHDGYKGCYYQFYTPTDYPRIAVRLIKWSSKKEAKEDFRMQVRRHVESWGITPQFLYGVADSAYFNFDGDDTTKCDECSFVAVQDIYGIYISFKGEYEKVPRAKKLLAALKIIQIMYDRIPGLAPSRIRNLNQ